jgi:hypothetical protein
VRVCAYIKVTDSDACMCVTPIFDLFRILFKRLNLLAPTADLRVCGIQVGKVIIVDGYILIKHLLGVLQLTQWYHDVIVTAAIYPVYSLSVHAVFKSLHDCHLEMARDLLNRVLRVNIFEYAPEILPSPEGCDAAKARPFTASDIISIIRHGNCNLK